MTPIDFGDVCINYDKEGLSEAGLAPPAELADLTRPEYRGTLVVEHPATSSPGLAFLLATIAEFGEDGWTDFWVGLRDNDVAVTAGWDEAYYSSFSGGSGEGDRPLVVSYASSPPAEVIFSETPMDEAPTGVVTAGCYRQVEFAGVLKGTGNEGAAGSLVDFMLSPAFQEQIPLAWFVFPANETVELPPEFAEHTVIPESPAAIEPEAIESNREIVDHGMGGVDGGVTYCPAIASALDDLAAGSATRGFSRLPLRLPAGSHPLHRSQRRWWCRFGLCRVDEPSVASRCRLVHSLAGGAVHRAHPRLGAAHHLGALPIRLPRAERGAGRAARPLCVADRRDGGCVSRSRRAVGTYWS